MKCRLGMFLGIYVFIILSVPNFFPHVHWLIRASIGATAGGLAAYGYIVLCRRSAIAGKKGRGKPGTPPMFSDAGGMSAGSDRTL